MKEQSQKEKMALLEEIAAKDRERERHDKKIRSMEAELDTARVMKNIQRAAEVQANRDLVLKEREKEQDKMRRRVDEMEKTVAQKQEAEANFKVRIKDLEVSRSDVYYGRRLGLFTSTGAGGRWPGLSAADQLLRSQRQN